MIEVAEFIVYASASPITSTSSTMKLLFATLCERVVLARSRIPQRKLSFERIIVSALAITPAVMTRFPHV